MELYLVVAPGLTHDFPTLRTVGFHPTNVPPRLASLIGRERELASLTELVGSLETSVVTLVGAGGRGKTSLAAALGAEALSTFPDGVFFVDLSALTDPSLVVPQDRPDTGAARDRGSLADRHAGRPPLRQEASADPRQSRAGHRRRNRHRHTATGAPDVKVLTTSPEALRIGAETRFLSPPSCSLPGEQSIEILWSPAAQLSLGRARAVRRQEVPRAGRRLRRLEGAATAFEEASKRIDKRRRGLRRTRLGHRSCLSRRKPGPPAPWAGA